MDRISQNARGVVRIEVFGAFPEGLLNLAAAEEIELWDAERSGGNSLRFSLYEGRLGTLESLAEKNGCELTVLAAKGGRRALRRLRRRAWLLLGLTVMLVCLTLSSLFVWRIELHGTERLSRTQVLRALEDCGVGVGSFWPGLDVERVRSEMMLRLPEIGWMAVNVSGSRAVVLIRERLEKPELYREKAARDLVAGKSGIVRRVSVLAGIGEVRPGQAVTAGETLIRGQRVGLGGAEEELCARGDVMAETWTERIAVCPAIEERKEAAGAGRSRFALLFGKRRLNLYFGSRKTLDGYDKMLSEYTLGVPGLFSLPIRVVRERLIPCTHRAERCAEPEEMAERLRRDLVGGTEGQILQMDFSSGESGGLLIVTLRAHCIENIAEERAQTP